MTGSFVVNAFVLCRMNPELEGWPKPSEEEVQKWEEQRKLRDRISSEMGQYLLKGYKMLDKTCKECAVGCCIQYLHFVYFRDRIAANRCICTFSRFSIKFEIVDSVKSPTH